MAVIINVSDLFLQISPQTPLITAFHMFSEKRVSALPVVDDNGMVHVIVVVYFYFVNKKT